MPNDAADFPSLDELVSAGSQYNTPPEQLAQGVLKWRDDARQQLKEAAPDEEQYFNGAQALDRDVQGALGSIQQQTQTPLPKLQQATNAAFPLIGAGNTELGVYRIQKGVGDNLEVQVNIHRPDSGQIDRGLFSVPMVTQDDVSKRIADLTKKRQGYLTTADEFASNEDAYGFRAQKMAEDEAAKTSAEIMQFDSPNGRSILQQERIADAFKNSALGKTAGQWGLGEDLLRGTAAVGSNLDVFYNSLWGSQEDLKRSQQTVQSLDELYPGTTRPGTGPQFARGLTSSAPMLALSAVPGGQVIMGLQSFGSTKAEAMGLAEQADKQAEALDAQHPELAEKFRDMADRMRGDANTYAGLTGATWGLMGSLLPEVKGFAAGTAKAGIETGGAQALAGNVIKPAFTGESDDPLNILSAALVGAAAHAAVQGGVKAKEAFDARSAQPTPQPASQPGAATQTPPGSGQGWTQATANGQQAPPQGPASSQQQSPPNTGQSTGQTGARGQQQSQQRQQTNAGQSSGQQSAPPPQPSRGPAPRQFNTQADFNAYMDNAVKAGDVENARDAFAMNDDKWRKQWIKSKIQTSDQHAEFINSIFGGRSNAEHDAYSSAQANARQAGAGTPSGSGAGGQSGTAGPTPQARAAPEPAAQQPVEPAPEATSTPPDVSEPVSPADQVPNAPESPPVQTATPPAESAPSETPPSLSTLRDRRVAGVTGERPSPAVAFQASKIPTIQTAKDIALAHGDPHAASALQQVEELQHQRLAQTALRNPEPTPSNETDQHPNIPGQNDLNPDEVAPAEPPSQEGGNPPTLERRAGNDSLMANTVVIVNKQTGEAVMETANPAVVQKLNTAKYEAVPTDEYLGRLNQKPEEPSNATIESQGPQGDVTEHQGAAQRPAVQTNEEEVRQEESQRSGGGNRILNREGIPQEAPQEVTTPPSEIPSTEAAIPPVAGELPQSKAGSKRQGVQGNKGGSSGGGSSTSAASGKPFVTKLTPKTRPQALLNFFKPGNIVPSYGGMDKVISFHGDPKGNWSVTVQSTDGRDDRRQRNHATTPSERDLIAAYNDPNAFAPKGAPLPPEAPQTQHGNLPHELQEPNAKMLANPVIRHQYEDRTRRAIAENRPVNLNMAQALGIPIPEGYAQATDVKSAEEQSAGSKDNPFPQEAPPKVPKKGMVIEKFMNDVKNAEGGFVNVGAAMRAVGINPQALTRAVQGQLGTWAGETFPKTTARDRVLGEKAARWISSKIAAPYVADVFSQSVAGNNPAFDYRAFGAALTEDNLRSIKADFAKAGDAKKAAAVGTIIGKKDSPFPTEVEYQAFLADPSTQQAVQRHISMWNSGVEPMYKQAMMLDAHTPLPSRGLQTGARVNLYAEDPNQPARGKPISTVGSGNLQGTMQRKSPFGRQAKGTGVYNIDYRDMMTNTFGRQLEVANKNNFEKELVRTGNAVIADPGDPQTLPDGEATEPFPLIRRQIVTDKSGVTTTIPVSKNIYVRNSLAGEYQRGSNVERWPAPAVLKGVATVLNRSALAGLTDATVHLSNLATVLFTRPIGNPIINGLMAATGRADIPYVLTKAILKSFQSSPAVKAQLARMAEIGALRETFPNRTSTNKLVAGILRAVQTPGNMIHAMDRAVRLIMDDSFDQMAKMGIVPNTETARREFINQVGQYNKRAQGDFMTLMRQTVAPFATAGRNFNVLGIRTATLNPGVNATSLGSSAVLKGNMLAKWFGFFVLAGTLNYLLTKDKGGGVYGRPGVKIGQIDTGMSDANNRPLTINAIDLVGLGRGLRVTGTRGVIESYRNGLPGGVIQDSAIRDIFNSNISPFAGPIIHFGFGLGNASPALDVGKPFPVVPPGESQLASNFTESMKAANPLVASYFDMSKPGATTFDWLRRQLPRFMMNPSNPPDMMAKYPEIVHKAQLNGYIDDVVHRARKMEPDARKEYIQGILSTLPAEDRHHAEQQFRYRRIR